MKVKFVPKSQVKLSRKSKSKYQELIDATGKLEPGGKALKVKYKDRKELNSMRNIIYSMNKENNMNIKSNKDVQNKIIYFYK